MARTLEQRLRELRALEPGAKDELAKLREALRAPIGVLVAAAAKHASDRTLHALVPELADAFARLGGEDGGKRDPGCRGKLAIVNALLEMDQWEERVLVAGLRIAQPEFGGDTAGAVRGLCGVAHARFARADALDVLAELLRDPEKQARLCAATGLGDAGRRDATALLRYKLLEGDREPEVISASLESLLALAREDSLPFVIRMLQLPDERAELAALALGDTHEAVATEPLIAWCDKATPAQRHRAGYVALSVLRTDRATSYLLGVIGSGSKADALAATRVLATFKEDAALRARIREAARPRKDRRDIEEVIGS